MLTFDVTFTLFAPGEGSLCTGNCVSPVSLRLRHISKRDISTGFVTGIERKMTQRVSDAVRFLMVRAICLSSKQGRNRIGSGSFDIVRI